MSEELLRRARSDERLATELLGAVRAVLGGRAPQSARELPHVLARYRADLAIRHQLAVAIGEVAARHGYSFDPDAATPSELPTGEIEKLAGGPLTAGYLLAAASALSQLALDPKDPAARANPFGAADRTPDGNA